MNINQVYSIVNSVANQIYGASNVAITDLTGLIQLGDTVFSSDSSKDNFLNTLVDRIGKTIISQRAYSAEVNSLINDSFTFGAILQKIYVEPISAETNPSWGLTAGSSVDQYVIHKPTVKQKLFSDWDTWQVVITIPDIQFRSAFTNESEMATFIDAIFLAMRNSMEVYLESMSEMCYANMIGERVVDTKINSGYTVIDLLSMYNTATSTNLTTTAAMMSTDFLKFATTTINLYVKRMGKMSVLYNSENYKRFTPTDRMRVVMLADFVAACTSYLQADTYHNELVSLPNYSEITAWQGSKINSSMGFDATGSVKIVTSSGWRVDQSYVVAMLSDIEAIGLTYDNRRSRSAYNADGEYTNYFEKADMGYFNDLSENCIIFTVGAVDIPTSLTVPSASQNLEVNTTTATDTAITITLNNDTFSKVAFDGNDLTVSTNYTYSSSDGIGTLTIKQTWLRALTDGGTLDIITSKGGEYPIEITLAS